MERPSNKQTNPFKLCNSQPEENREVDGVYAHGESSEMYAFGGDLNCNAIHIICTCIQTVTREIRLNSLI